MDYWGKNTRMLNVFDSVWKLFVKPFIFIYVFIFHILENNVIIVLVQNFLGMVEKWVLFSTPKPPKNTTFHYWNCMSGIGFKSVQCKTTLDPWVVKIATATTNFRYSLCMTG